MKDNKTEFRQLDPIKISRIGLDMFLKKYKVGGIATYSERLERLRLLSEDKHAPESDKKDMVEILKTLGKIANCNLCQKGINWDKGEGLYSINPTETARHLSCHKKTEEVIKEISTQ